MARDLKGDAPAPPAPKRPQDTPLQRTLLYVPPVMAEQVNERELLRVTKLMGFRD